ncbi:MAG: RNase adapter RapZ [Gammaproteobacteria bacterium]|nr:RNase adapter RapZ [Gammaproteobacteria bacterium]
MQLFLVSGLSGSGKSVALNTFEDQGFTCIDNLPVRLLKTYAEEELLGSGGPSRRIAIGIDVRAGASEMRDIPELVNNLRDENIDCRIIYLTTDTDHLIRRYNETRRMHPLGRARSGDSLGIEKAIEAERELLDPIADHADLMIDTTGMNVHELRQLLKARLQEGSQQKLSLLFHSFGFKHGAPRDADFVFDVRVLPNPYWIEELRPLSGRDPEITSYLLEQKPVRDMLEDIIRFLEHWLPGFEKADRDYLTIAIGCTGGRHRSVFIADQLGRHFAPHYPNTTVRHSTLSEVLYGEQLSLLSNNN